MSFEDVEISVDVEVANAHPHTGLFLAIFVQRYTAFETLFRKCAVAIVPEQEAGRGVTCDIDVGPTVSIEVGRDCRQAIGLRV